MQWNLVVWLGTNKNQKVNTFVKKMWNTFDMVGLLYSHNHLAACSSAWQRIHVSCPWKESMPVCTQDDVNIHTECTQSLYQNPCLLCIRVVAWILNALWHRWCMHCNVNVLWHGFWAHYAMDSRCMPPVSPHALKCDCSASDHEFWDSDMLSECKAMWILSASLVREFFCTMPVSILVSESTQTPFENAHWIPLRMISWSRLHTVIQNSGQMLQEPESMLHCMYTYTSSALMHPGSMSKCLLKQYQKALKLHSRMHSGSMSECIQNPY